MSNAITDVAETIKDAINAASLAGLLGQQVTAVRRWLPPASLENIYGVLVLVVARGLEETLATRSHDWSAVLVDVGILTRLTEDDDEATCDTIFDLIQNISGVLRNGLEGMSYKARTSDPIFDVVALQTQRLLRAATTYRFEVYHDVRV